MPDDQRSMPPDPPGESYVVSPVTTHHEGHEVELRPGWSRPKPEHIPRPTYWPIVMAVGVTCIFWGFITSALISIVGLILFGISLAGWIGEFRHGE